MTESNDDKIVFAGTLKDLNPKNPGWVMTPPDPANALVKEKIVYIKKGALWPYISNEKVYRCPSPEYARSCARS